MRTSLASLSVLLAFPLTAIGAGSDQGLKPFSVKLLDYTNPGKPGVVFSDPAGTGASGTTHNCQASTSMVKLCEWIAGEGPHTDYRLNVGTYTGVNEYPVTRNFAFRGGIP
ncbi:uncharacterized protein PFL1_04338 [Pseudozyma flocculosa PF-1]|uniref:Uncharacterized protein n=1 Tax=Pseudozyma flocculosa PF-1 TaxID=1277687 RepID=A0A061HBR4_9BASI|nr:uncharacterized protein PFL1_04338 [Pseudozyma flocculosa PF-1]EPQ28011.1 hypothetical protein PFL1_04338 [Pseudozyma flocculosa PF-1]